jgi:integrase
VEKSRRKRESRERIRQWYLFTPSQTWKSEFYRAIREAARSFGITLSGIHRLRANFAQNEYEKLREQGMSGNEARQKVSKLLGHNRLGVTKSYVP